MNIPPITPDQSTVFYKIMREMHSYVSKAILKKHLNTVKGPQLKRLGTDPVLISTLEGLLLAYLGKHKDAAEVLKPIVGRSRSESLFIAPRLRRQSDKDLKEKQSFEKKVFGHEGKGNHDLIFIAKRFCSSHPAAAKIAKSSLLLDEAPVNRALADALGTSSPQALTLAQKAYDQAEEASDFDVFKSAGVLLATIKVAKDKKAAEKILLDLIALAKRAPKSGEGRSESEFLRDEIERAYALEPLTDTPAFRQAAGWKAN